VYRNFIKECKNDISDQDDISILAVALACKTKGIWSHDPHFKEQEKVKVFTNIDMLRFSGKARMWLNDEKHSRRQNSIFGDLWGFLYTPCT
jgi:predicted nucleic acid-binding protein